MPRVPPTQTKGVTRIATEGSRDFHLGVFSPKTSTQLTNANCNKPAPAMTAGHKSTQAATSSLLPPTASTQPPETHTGRIHAGPDGRMQPKSPSNLFSGA